MKDIWNQRIAPAVLLSSRRGRLLQGTSLSVALLIALSLQLGAPTNRVSAGPTGNPSSTNVPMAPLPPSTVKSLQAAFPAGTESDPSVRFFADFTSWIADLGLTLETRNVERIEIAGQPARRIFSRISGSVGPQVELLGRILRRTPAVAPRSLRWDAGDSPEHRILELTIDLPTNNSARPGQ